MHCCCLTLELAYLFYMYVLKRDILYGLTLIAVYLINGIGLTDVYVAYGYAFDTGYGGLKCGYYVTPLVEYIGIYGKDAHHA